jgi:hypothetical protein
MICYLDYNRYTFWRTIYFGKNLCFPDRESIDKKNIELEDVKEKLCEKQS